MRTRTLLALAALPVLALLALPLVAEERAPSAPAAAGVEWHPDVVFGRADDTELRLDLARPRGLAGPAPAVVVIHGGGWAAGRRQAHGRLVRDLAAAGFVAATVDYRLAPKHPWPAQVEDVKCAVRWLRANAAAWSVDPARIAALGFSAGGHLAMLLGAMDPEDGLEGDGGSPGPSSKVEAVVSFFGPTDLTAKDQPPAVGKLLDALFGPEFASDRSVASPIAYVDGRDAPMLLFQGTRDPLVPKDQALKMADALTSARVPGRVVLLLGQAHGWGEPLLGETVDDAVRFLRVELGP